MTTPAHYDFSAPITTAPAQTTRVLRDAGWNLGGSLLPLAAAFFAIPILIKTLGTDRFGLITLAWAAVGYFSFLDFGLGRALTKCVSESLAGRDQTNIPDLFWSSIILLGAFSVAGSGLLCLVPAHFIGHILKIPAVLSGELRLSLWLLAATVPLVTLSAMLRGFLEAHRWFRSINIVRALLGLATFLFPVAILKVSPTLPAVLGSLALGRLGACFAYLVLCFQATPGTRLIRWISWPDLRPLLAFGGWITLSNTISPLMSYLDRFFVSVLLSLGAVSYYATPYEITSKILVVPLAIAVSLFPAFAALVARGGLHLAALYNEALAAVFHCTYPISILLILFAHDGIRLWLGADFALKSYRVVQINAIGLLVTSLAQIPSTYCQATGRPDINAKFQVCELPIYLASAFVLTLRFGIVGAAVAGAMRTAIDALLLFGYVHRRKVALRKTFLMAFGLSSAIAAAMVGDALAMPIRLAIGIVVVITSVFSLVGIILRAEGATAASAVCRQTRPARPESELALR